MCYFPYVGACWNDATRDDLAVRLGYRSPGGELSAAAASHGLKLVALAVIPGTTLAELFADCDEVYSVSVSPCACDWGAVELSIAKKAVFAMAQSGCVQSVTWALYAIAGDVAEGRCRERVAVIDVTVAALAGIELVRDMAVRVTNVR